MSYPPYSCTTGPNEEIAEELIQTMAGALSVFGSCYIAQDVLKRHFRQYHFLSCRRCQNANIDNGTNQANNEAFTTNDSRNFQNSTRRPKKTTATDPYQRIMLGLSFFDICHSFFDSFMGTWMTPSETGWLMASGNQVSCSAQGFFTAFGFMGSFVSFIYRFEDCWIYFYV